MGGQGSAEGLVNLINRTGANTAKLLVYDRWGLMSESCGSIFSTAHVD